MEFAEFETRDLIIWGVGAIVIIAIALMAKRNRANLSRWAQENGFQYSAPERFPPLGVSSWKYTLDGKHDGAWFRQYADFYPFNDGIAQRIWEHLIREKDGLEWRVFRFDSDRSTEGSKTHLHWICVVKGPFDFPALQVRPVGFKDKLAGLFGKRDIETGLGEFDSAFHVSSEDESFARDFLDSGMKKFLMEQGTFRWQVQGPYAMLVWPHSYDVKDVELMLFAMRRFLEHVPKSVR